MRKIKSLISILLTLSVCVSLSACSKSDGYKAFTEDFEISKLNGEQVVEGSNYSLIWDSKNKRIKLYDKKMQTYWSTTPSPALENDPMVSGKKNHPQVDSALYITYYDNANYCEKIAYSTTSATNKGGVSAQKITNGFSITYFFKNEGISVTVDYVLTNSGMDISIDNTKFTENEKNQLIEVSLAPFICGIENNSENSYLFVPSGSGALIYSDIDRNTITTTSEPVFGKDYAVDEEAEFTKTEAIRLPVYGSVLGNKGMCAIIKSGAESAEIRTISCNEKLGYATVYSTFLVRGYDLIDTPDGFSTGQIKPKLYSSAVDDKIYTLSVTPLYDEKASYVGMAEEYRNYLNLQKAKNTFEKAINVKVLGGVETKKFFCGIPYSSLYTLTSLEDAQEIIAKLNKITDSSLNISLVGYGESGMDIGKIGGGFKISNALGTKKDFFNLSTFCKKNGIGLYLNFDLLQFSKSASGFSVSLDSAVATSGKRVNLTYKSLSLKNANKKFDSYRIVSRKELSKTTDELFKSVKKYDLTSISLDTLTSMAYSDYNNPKYFAKGNMPQDVSAMLDNLQKNNLSIMSSSANEYAVKASSFINDTPIYSSKCDGYDAEVPFYQIVFKGYKAMATPSVNLSDNMQKSVLKAIETGIGLSFTLSKNYDKELMNSSQNSLYATNYISVENAIKNELDNGYFEIFETLKDATITKHYLINQYLHKTVFDNGMIIYTNYSNTNIETEGITVGPESYVLMEAR